MVPDMIAVYHLQKNKQTGVYALTWNRQIIPIQTRQTFKFPFKLKSQQPSEELRGALELIDTEKQRKWFQGIDLRSQ